MENLLNAAIVKDLKESRSYSIHKFQLPHLLRKKTRLMLIRKDNSTC